jgi:hypothetical protein
MTNIMRSIEPDFTEELMSSLGEALGRISQGSKDETPLTMASIKQHLWKASRDNNMPYMGFYMPRVKYHCLFTDCESPLYSAKSSETCITVFTMDGPLPCLKASLRCSNREHGDCAATYGLLSYQRKTDGVQTYEMKDRLDLQAVSQKQYCTNDVANLLTASG